MTADAGQRRAAEQASLSGEAVAAPLGDAVGSRSSEPDFLFYLPVYRDGSTPPAAADRCGRTIGYFVAQVRVRALCEAALSDLESEGLGTRIFDATPPGQARLLYVSGGDFEKNAAPERTPQRGETLSDAQQRVFEFGGRRWAVACQPTPQWISRQQFWSPWLVLVSGLAFAGLTGVYALRILTEERSVERVVKQRTQELRKVSRAMDQSPAGVVITDPDGTIEYVNPRFSVITGYAPAEAIGRNPRFLKSHRHPPEFYAELWQTIRAGGEWKGEFCNCRKNGELYWEATSISPIRDEDGKIAHFVAVKEDVTARKQAEEMLRRTEEQLLKAHSELEVRVRQRTAELARANAELETAKTAAEAASRAKSAFLANMSHEIRTPMMAILGFTELLTHRNITKGKHRKYLEAIQRNGRSLQQLIKDILDFSKIEAGKMTVEHLGCSPWQLLEDVLSLTGLRARKKKLELRVYCEYPLPAVIQTDPLRLRQILVNLVGNAIKFTERGGVQIHVSLTRQSARGPLLRFAVKDTGIGISDEGVALLFQPLTQVDSSMTRRFGGTGLGLAISKQLARMLGGDIEVFSTPGHGSQFVLTVATGDLAGVAMLDAAPDISRSQAHGPEEWERSLQGRVLLAEDAPDSQELLRTILERFGLTVDVAENGHVALQKALAALAERRPYDLVLMDIQMPEMDGCEVTRRLRTAGWLGAIVALTAHGTSEDRERCLQAGCNDYLSKPIAQRSLYEKLHGLVPHRDGGASADQPSPRRRMARGVVDAQGIDADEKARLTALFRDNLTAESVRLERGLAEHNKDILADSAHKMAGAAGMFGFQRLSEAARSVEDMLRCGVDVSFLQGPASRLLLMAKATASHIAVVQQPETAD